MKKTLKSVLIMTLVAIISVLLTLPIFEAVAIEESWFWIVGFFFSIVTIPWAIVRWVVYLSECFGKRVPSPYLLFGIIIGILMVTFAVWGIYDLKTDEGLLPGLLGALVLWFVVPFLMVVLVIDIILGLVQRKKNRKNNVL